MKTSIVEPGVREQHAVHASHMGEQHFPVNAVPVDDLAEGPVIWQEKSMKAIPGRAAVDDQCDIRHPVQNVPQLPSTILSRSKRNSYSSSVLLYRRSTNMDESESLTKERAVPGYGRWPIGVHIL